MGSEMCIRDRRLRLRDLPRGAEARKRFALISPADPRSCSVRFSEFELKGLRLEPGQVWGSVRIAAIIRDEVTEDLRLTPREHDSSWVRSTYPKTDFFSYMPRAFILSWGKDSQAVSTAETHLGKHRPEKLGKLWRRRGKRELAFLPQSLAIDCLLYTSPSPRDS